MVDLVYDETYDARYAALLDTIERLERQVEPMAATASFSFEAGLTAYDLQRLIRLRDRYPHWRDEKFVPPLFVQKAMLRDGHYGPDSQRRTFAHDCGLSGQ